MENVDHFQIVLLPHFEIVGIVSRSHFYTSGTKLRIYITVFNDRYFSTDQRKNNGLAFQMGKSFIIRIYGDCRIAQHCFRTGGGYHNIFVRVPYRIAEVPEMTLYLLIFYLFIGDGRLCRRIPVYKPVTTINKSLFV